MPAETRARRRIRKAVEARGGVIEDITWTPLSMGGDMAGGCDGGWEVTLRDEPDYVIGENLDELLDAIDRDMGPAGIFYGDRVRVASGDYEGQTGTYDGVNHLGSRLVHLDGDAVHDPPVQCDVVELVAPTPGREAQR